MGDPRTTINPREVETIRFKMKVPGVYDQAYGSVDTEYETSMRLRKNRTQEETERQIQRIYELWNNSPNRYSHSSPYYLAMKQNNRWEGN